MQWLTRHNSTWIYENWVGRHFEISLNFPGLLSHLFLVVSWLGICVEVVVDRISWIRVLSNSPPPPSPPYLPASLFGLLPSLLRILCVTQAIVFGNQCAPKADFVAASQFQESVLSGRFIFRYWSAWEKLPGEHHVTLRDGTKFWIRFAESTSFPGFTPTRPYRAREVGERTWERGCSRVCNWVCIAKYLTVFTFHLTKLIKSPWSWLKQKGTILFAFLRSPLRLWPWKQGSRSQIYLARAKLQANFDQGQDVKTESMLVCRACDGTSGKLNTTRVREICRGVYLSKVSVSPSYLMTFSSVKRERIMRGCG